jgi:hypothetical protein
MTTSYRPVAAALLALCWMPLANALTLVEAGKSSYVIHLAEDAPASVQAAVRDLQKYLAQATGAKLAVVNAPTPAMISIGDTPAARQAGIVAAELPWEGYRIATRGKVLFVVGRDTGKDERAPGGGVSNGTRNGVSTFLEDYVGVRWLMPGENGDYVPKQATLSIPEVDTTAAPFFRNRRLPYTQERKAVVKTWWARQKLGVELALSHGHNWRRSIPPEHFDAHPDWFAEAGGKRMTPSGRYKLCLTNEGMIDEFARVAGAWFDTHPAGTFSLSPSDSAGWCTCKRCEAMYEDDPHGKLSVTPAVIHFYNEVAKRTAAFHPKRILAGYVYAQYVYPPKKPIPLHANVFLVWAPSFDYGFTLFRPELQKQWDALAPQWTAVTENIAYYDLPNCVHNGAGAPNPPGAKILKFLYPRLKQHRMKGVYVYGTSAWGHAALMNYLLAKLDWDPDADVDAVFDEFCEKAYGKGGEEMKRFYRLLDAETERYFIAHEEETYNLSSGRTKDVYAANFPELERLYQAANAKITDPAAKARLAMLGTNLTILHWNLRQYNFLENPTASSFHMADAPFLAFMGEHKDSLAVAPPSRRNRAKLPKGKLTVTVPKDVPNREPAQPFVLRGPQLLVVKPTGDEPAVMRFRMRRTYGSLLWYHVHDPDGNELSRGTLNSQDPAPLPEVDVPYFLVDIQAGPAFYTVQIDGAAWAAYGRVTDKGLHFLGEVSPLYFTVPKGLPSFKLWLAATPPGETGAATLFSPTGRVAAEYDCSLMQVDQKRIDVRPGEAGIWKIVARESKTGVLDDLYIKPGDKLPGYLSFSAEQFLQVIPAGK